MMRVRPEVFNRATPAAANAPCAVAGNAVATISCKPVKKCLIALVLLIVIAYGADFLWLRYRMATQRNPFGSVTLSVYYSVKLKNGKVEFSYGGEQTFECPNSLFPQYMEKPCWFVRRKRDVQIDVDSGNPNNPSLF